MGFDILQYLTSVGCDICEGGVNRGGTGGGDNEGGTGGGDNEGGGGGGAKLNGNAVAIPAVPKFKARVEAIAVNNFFIGLRVNIYKI
ncbi:MAG: hypothetical protein F6K24_37800 [Okeania sp. SIO2D1]|nr:hypothetical protein [Okeania sp. SIO2D1]